MFRANVFNAATGKAASRIRLLVLLSSCAVILPLHAHAQDADVSDAGTTLKPITLKTNGSPVGPDQTIVAKNTRAASKTDTPVLDAPVSVSIVTEEELEERGVTNLDEALSYTPGVSTDVYGSDNRYDHYMIRGFYASNSTYRDGLPLRVSNFTGSRMEPYGLQRLEVLKGANSTLFGLSSPGGIVNAVTKRPQDFKFGEVYTTFGEDHIETGTDFGGPIDPDGMWSYRLTAKWQDAKQGIEYSNDDRIYIAPALTFSPSADTDFTLLMSYSKRDGSTAHSIPYLSGIDSETYLAEPDFDNMDTIERNIGYEFRHDFGNGLEFRQNARYTDLDMVYQQVYTATPVFTDDRAAFDVDGSNQRFDIDNQFQYDANIGRFDSRTLFGFSYEHDKLREASAFGSAGPIDPFNPIYCGRACITLPTKTVTDSTQIAKSVYLQEELTLDDRWIFTLGGRYDHVDTASGGVNATDEAFTTRAGLTYKATNELSFYASYMESFLPVGADRSRYVGTPQPQEGTQYEIGMKYQPEGIDALFTVALFDLSQTNVPQYQYNLDGTFQVLQIGKTKVRGIEFESKIALSDRLDLIAGYSYWDAKIDSDLNSAIIGNRPETVPNHVASLWANYTVPGNGALGDLTLGVGARFVGGIYGDNENTVKLPSRTLIDAAVKYQVTESVALSVNATNLFDKEFISDVDTSSNSAFYGDRRKVLGTLKYTW